MRIGFIFHIYAAVGAAFLLAPTPADAASAACSGTALTELRMTECLSPATRGIRPANAASQPAPPPAAAAAPTQAAARPPAASPPEPGLDLEIKFPFASSDLSPDAKALLQKLAHVLGTGDLASRNIKVVGHTDAAGRDDLNQALSTARAQAVSAYLAEQGISGQRLQASGVGKADHKNPRDPMAAENRRVEIVPAG